MISPTLDWAGNTALDSIALLPVIGGLKYADEIALIAKNSDEAAEAAKGAGKVDGVVKGAATLSYEEAEELAFQAIKGSNKADAVVLGKYDNNGPTGYMQVAKDMNAQYFNLENYGELSAKYSDDEIWKINEKFLDTQTSSGREIYLSHNPKKFAKDGSFFSKEIQYLEDNGYHFIKEGDIWHAVR